MITKTYMPKQKDIVKEWYIVDATDKILGRLATEVASKLLGKGKAIFTPHMDTGDEVVVINAAKVKTTGNKLKDKVYKRYTAYPGGYKEIPLERMLVKHSDEVIRHAVRGMLPKTKLGASLLKKLRVYPGPEHRQSAQRPAPLGQEKAKGKE